jgi:hypothetical protein
MGIFRRESWGENMIPVAMQPEPASFNTRVRTPGNVFLATCPNPNHKDWGRNTYWQRAADDLYRLYGGICAYTGEWFSRTSTSCSVDHFMPKSVVPHLAYEWNNLRLTTQKANNYKADYVGIADPFQIASGWFALDLPSCLVKPGSGLSTADYTTVEKTIKILKLNDDDEYVQRRCV